MVYYIVKNRFKRRIKVAIDVTKVGLYIQELRKKKNMTQNQLGERLSVSYQAVSKWERGESLPDTAILMDLSSILETTIDSVLKGSLGCRGYYTKYNEWRLCGIIRNRKLF